MKNNLKSALAFFFLFFLHGTSIGTRQQGISYNECLAENTEVLSTSNIFSVHLQNSPQGSDGYIQLTDDLTFYKLFLTDDLIPANPSRIVVKKGTPFPIEIGTNSVLKTWEYFANYITLATFPYNCPLITETPMLALFYINK